MVEHLPSKHKALISDPSTTTKAKRKKTNDTFRIRLMSDEAFPHLKDQ
jgi:hypothetical protein